MTDITREEGGYGPCTGTGRVWVEDGEASNFANCDGCERCRPKKAADPLTPGDHYGKGYSDALRDVASGAHKARKAPDRAELARLIRGCLITEREPLEIADAILALSPAPQPEQGLAAGWRPIETAPKDGTFADLWHRDQGRVANCRWLTNALGFTAWHAQQGGRGWNMGEDDNFTHWMPLPASPSNPTTTDQGEDGR